MNNFLESIIKRDPAAGNKLNVILNYPGVKAVFFHFIANKLWSMNLKIIGRMISQFSRFLTGIVKKERFLKKLKMVYYQNMVNLCEN